MGFSRIQRAALVKAYFTNKSYKKCVKVFQPRFPDGVKSSKSTVCDLIKRFRETGGVNDRKRSERARAATPTFVEDVKERLQQSGDVKSLLNSESGNFCNIPYFKFKEASY
jgi:transposase